MYISQYDFNASVSQDDVDQIMNDLALNLDDFSKLACLDGRAYGVIKACGDCEIEINSCLRQHLVRKLASVQELIERSIGWNLTPRYHTQTILWDGRSRIQTSWPGVESVGLARSFASVPDYGPFDISPFIEQDIAVWDSGEGHCIASFDASLTNNPNKAFIRDDAFRYYPTFSRPGLPMRSGDVWDVALDTVQVQVPACDIGGPFHVQHCDYMVLDVPNGTCEDGTMVPVYPDSNQIIPQARPAQAIPGDETRYWFHPWVLVDAAFAGEDVDLLAGEFYKLLQEIEFKCMSEVACAPVVEFQKEGCPATTWELDSEDITMHIVDARNGILHVEHADLRCLYCSGSLGSCGCRYPLKLTFCYKTSPDVLGANSQLNSLKEAIGWGTAAELPMTICECRVEQGFIAEAQKPYTTIRVNPVTGENLVDLKFGNLHGHLVFGERVHDAQKWRRLVKL